MKLLMYITAFILFIYLLNEVRKDFNIPKSKYRKQIVIGALLLSLLGWLSLPGLMQKLLFGCNIDFIQKKTTYVTQDRTYYFYELDSGLGIWSNTNLKRGDAICP
jgi:hypothetical protein